MVQRVSLLRMDFEEMPVYLANQERLREDMLNGEVNPTTTVVDLDKSLEGIVFTLTGNKYINAEDLLTSFLRFKLLAEDNENGNVFFSGLHNVGVVHTNLSEVTDERFIALRENMVYPETWDQAKSYNEPGYLVEDFRVLRKFYEDASKEGQTIIGILT